MSIIDKLEIPPTRVNYTATIFGQEINVITEYTVRKIEEQRNEMLDVLINLWDGAQFCISKTEAYGIIEVVEKATGKTWEEIQEIIEDE